MKIEKQGVTIELELDEVKKLILDNFNEDEIMDIIMFGIDKRKFYLRNIAERFFDDYKDEIHEHYSDDIKKLVHHRDVTVGLHATDIEPLKLFEKCFSDGTSLRDETSTISGEEYDEMSDKWFDFCKKNFHQITE